MRRWQIILLAGLIGVASLTLIPIEMLIARPIAPFTLRLLACIQPAILTALAVIAGEYCAKRVGLSAPLVDAWVAGRSGGAVIRRQIEPTLAVGIGLGAILVLYAHWLAPHIMAPTAHGGMAGFDLPILSKLLYGGVTEEILMRYGTLSLTAWLAWRLMRQAPDAKARAIWIGIVLSAFLFAAGHLPFLFLVTPHTPGWIVAAVMVSNAVPGIALGLLFWRRGLEAAVMAHMIAHLSFWLVTLTGV
ncbi:CPBP family intramembrane metalloprotease [soil metagenome]